MTVCTLLFHPLLIACKEGIPPWRLLFELLEEDLATEATHVLPHLRHEVPRENSRHIRNLVSIGDDDEGRSIRLGVDRSDLEVFVELFDVVFRDFARRYREWLTDVRNVLEWHGYPFVFDIDVWRGSRRRSFPPSDRR